MILESSEFPSVDESNLVRPYTESFHIIHPTYTYCSEDVKALPSYSRKCLFEDEMRVRHFGEYSSSDCSLLCYIDLIQRHCNCLMHYVPYVRHERACNISSIPCIAAVRIQLTNWHEDDCDCPRDCESFNYRSEVMLGNLNALEQLAENPYEGIVFNKSTSLLNFNLPRTSYVKKKQETVMSVVIFFSNLGGVFGLCQGCSIISLFEVLFYIYMAIRNKFKNRVKVQPLNYVN
ncbi:sodium channel protein Nach-like [Pieris napi]|uniref:sodium channel protein Nach-like n=1 Tax=Pieris napi TaxID=78633 RepID=UPI001FB9C372|nr:sodium channel protein Nach-like [Pieris napi]